MTDLCANCINELNGPNASVQGRIRLFEEAVTKPCDCLPDCPKTVTVPSQVHEKDLRSFSKGYFLTRDEWLELLERGGELITASCERVPLKAVTQYHGTYYCGLHLALSWTGPK